MSQNLGIAIAGLFEPCAFEKITIDNTVGGVGFTASNLRTVANPDKDVQRALVTVETAPIRYTYDGTAPTTTDGHLLSAGTVLLIIGQPALDNFKAIRTTATSGIIQVTYER